MSTDDAGGRMRLVRAASILLALMARLFLVQAAVAHAGVMQKYRGAHKNKLAYYRHQMDVEDTFCTAWRQAAESHGSIIATAHADPEQAKYVPEFEERALSEHTMLQEDVTTYGNEIYADTAAFKAQALDWFKTKADKNQLKASITTMCAGFAQMFSADDGLMQALYLLGTNADVAGANNEIVSAGMTATTAEDPFGRGLKQLRALR